MMKEACEILHIKEPRVIEQNGFRWTLTDELTGSELLKLERMLQELTGRPIDLRVEPRTDKNRRAERNGRE
jgi:hypothetical protein